MNETSLCVIARDDRENLAYMLDQVQPYVNEVVIVDTGSLDGTRELAEDRADVFIDGSFLLDSDGFLSDFSAARTLAHDAGTKAWQLWFDSDDDLSDPKKLPYVVDMLEEMREDEPRPVVGALLYEYSWNGDRTRCLQAFYRDRIVRKDDGFKWIRPVHECLDVPRTSAIVKVPPGTLRVVHMSSGGRGVEDDRNLRILHAWKTNDPARDYYIGDELLFRSRFEEAAKAFLKVPPLSGDFYWRGRLRAARAMGALRNVQQALCIIEEAIWHSRVPNLLLERGRLRLMQGEWNLAESDMYLVALGDRADPSEDPRAAFNVLADAVNTYRHTVPHPRLVGRVDVGR